MRDACENLPIVVLISGFGSNLQAIIDQTRLSRLPVEIRAVVSDRADAYGLRRAREAGIPTSVVDPGDFPDREAFDVALTRQVASYSPELVALAGFMRIVGPVFLAEFEGRALNIHPSLLPRHRGLHTHQRALAAGDHEHGSSVHFVTGALDGGPVILQIKVPVLPGDDAERLSARVQSQEHIIYPLAIRWYAAGQLAMREDRVWLYGLALAEPVVVEAATVEGI